MSKREKIASKFMVQCQNGEPFECPHLADCPHEDKEICLWQLEQADEMIELFKSLALIEPPAVWLEAVFNILCDFLNDIESECKATEAAKRIYQLFEQPVVKLPQNPYINSYGSLGIQPERMAFDNIMSLVQQALTEAGIPYIVGEVK